MENLLTRPMESQLDLEVLNVFPRGGRHVDTCLPGEQGSGGAGYHHSMFCILLLDGLNFCFVQFGANVSVHKLQKPSKGNRQI